MKLAQALIERKALQDAVAKTASDLFSANITRDGESPFADPNELHKELREKSEALLRIVQAINRGNNTVVHEGMTLSDLFVAREWHKSRSSEYAHLANAARDPGYDFEFMEDGTRRQTKNVVTIGYAEFRALADKHASEARRLDAIIQRTDWEVDITV